MHTAHLADAGYDGQMYSDAWGQGEPDSADEEASFAKIDRALAMEVNIPLDNKGELVTFREVRQWKMPTLMELTRLKERINNEWIKPLNLKQQDIVNASGLGAPYVCYLLKDPNSPNMNRRRKIEVYSVLTELFRKYDSKVVTKDDFTRLRNTRIANRFQGPRQDRTNRAAGAAANAVKQQRRRRRRGPYGEEDDGDEDDASTVDEDLQDSTAGSSTRARRKRRQLYGQGVPGGAYPGYEMGYMKGYYGQQYHPQQQPQQYPMPWMPSANVPYWPPHQYVYAYARGQRFNEQGEVLPLGPEGRTFAAPYSQGFPPVIRNITSLQSVVDGPPPTGAVAPDLEGAGAGTAYAPANPINNAAHDAWVKSKLNKQCLIPKIENSQTVCREPSTHAFVFLVEPNSCLLPVGVRIGSDTTSTTAGDSAADDDLWNISALRRYAEREDWLAENRECDDSLWVLWDIRESGASVQSLFERWRHDHHLNEEQLNALARSFLSQYVYLRDTELAFQALLPHAPPNEEFSRAVEINCDLVEERIRVKDSFVWDIRASDWDLTALLSNFVSDFQLDSPAISSLFIDLKITILRYRKDWVASMLERLTAEGKIDPSRVIPHTMGLSR
ncbi:hypothetical protein GNI_136930 [Gregarina niphandrodes]|uniref:Uncharacterized protein n=1 Tax=Gregarina niphandrodes TaxID=110365 RepID=A0A023B0Q2_GRENI|nr:hypothetical protein GNI_136930 [Gregarina niphandrodes]EZG45746.1 hypothetical protein GNI_136930 [Gregarina niphandrodes]|eukprot:XP_011132452.1 hypothetical protein GNI_136930 [Gregarina niphandrodes]